MGYTRMRGRYQRRGSNVQAVNQARKWGSAQCQGDDLPTGVNAIAPCHHVACAAPLLSLIDNISSPVLRLRRARPKLPRTSLRTLPAAAAIADLIRRTEEAIFTVPVASS